MTRKDLGLAAVEQISQEMAIDEPWSVREPRGFTWWGSWVRQRVWAGKAVRSHGETLWHVRARTAAYRDVPDEPATYAFVNSLNELPGLSAYSYDADARTISADCGALTYDAIDEWLQRFLRTSVALQASVAAVQVPGQSEGRVVDDTPHPSSGRRRDPDDMLNLINSFPRSASSLTRATLRTAARTLAAEGASATFDETSSELRCLFLAGLDGFVGWALSTDNHPFLGSGVLTRVFLPADAGVHGAAWLANSLNLAEASDWAGEDRPHAFGAWTVDGRFLAHAAFYPSVVLGSRNEPGDGALTLIRNLVAWGAMRTKFAADRLPWLRTAAQSKYPDDIMAEVGPDRPSEGDSAQDEPTEPFIPFAERSFGPESRPPRPRDPGTETGTTRELLVDPADGSAFHEIDDAVAVAEDGDRIVVRPGTYRRPVVIDRAVRIEGDGPLATIRVEPRGGEAVGVAASGASIAGLTIRPAETGNDGSAWSAVAVHDVAVTIEGCDLSSHLGATVWIGGPGARVVLMACSITDGSQNALWVLEEARAELVGCRVAGNRWPMMVGGEHTSLSIVDSEVVENLDGGVAAAAGAVLIIERTVIARNAGFGIQLLGAAPGSRVEDATVEDNASVGILVSATRGARVLRNRIRRNDIGIIVVAGAAPSIEANDIAGNRIGLGVRGEDSDPVVLNNTVTGGADEGVIVDESASGRFEGNRVSRSGGVGVWVDNAGTRPTFAQNHVSDCASVGILITNGAGGDFRANDLRGNTGGSWFLRDEGKLVRTANLEDTGTPTPGGPSIPPGSSPRRVN